MAIYVVVLVCLCGISTGHRVKLMAVRVHMLSKISASDTTVNAPDTYQHGRQHLLIDLEGPVRGGGTLLGQGSLH